MKAETTALIHDIGKTVSFPNSTFTKRDLILNLDPHGKYENVISVTFVKDQTKILDEFKVGERVTVEYYIQGRSYLKDGENESKRKYFNELRGFSVKSDEIETMKPKDVFKGSEFEPIIDDQNDDLPF